MRILVIGLGRVGLPTVCHLANLGHTVFGYDTNKELVQGIKEGKNPLPWEPGVDVSKLTKVTSSAFGSLLEKIDLVYVIVPTLYVSGEGLSATSVIQVRDEIRAYRWSGPLIIGSTLDPRSIAEVFRPQDTSMAYNPPLIRLGHVLEDLQTMSLMLFGREPSSSITESMIRTLWATQWSPMTQGNVLSIAVAKLAINTTLSSKIAWANEVAETARHLGASAEIVLEALHADPRIGEAYMVEGWPASGPCLPRDLVVWNESMKSGGVTISSAVVYTNHLVRNKIVSNVLGLIGNIKDPHVAVLGITYNPRALDITESRGVSVTRALMAHGIPVHVYDPAIRCFLGIADLPVVDSIEQALNKANVVVLATPWHEFSTVNFGTRFVIDLCGKKS